MKNVVKCYKDFFGYFIALKTHCEYDLYNDKLKVRTLALALVSISADTKGTIILLRWIHIHLPDASSNTNALNQFMVKI